MVQVQNKLGKDKFPLIDQTYFPNHKEMVSILLVDRLDKIYIAKFQMFNSTVDIFVWADDS